MLSCGPAVVIEVSPQGVSMSAAYWLQMLLMLHLLSSSKPSVSVDPYALDLHDGRLHIDKHPDL